MNLYVQSTQNSIWHNKAYVYINILITISVITDPTFISYLIIRPDWWKESFL